MPFTDFLANLKEEVISKNVPIIGDHSIAFLRILCQLHQPQTILEIGSAVGYSASWFTVISDAKVYTMEKNIDLYNIAKLNIIKQNLEDRVTLFCGDALELADKVNNLEVDLLFIDAAKGQYQKFFEMYAPLVKKGGLIISDNLYFHDLLFAETSKQTHGLTKKLVKYNDYLLSLADFTTTILDIGDGLGVTVKCK